MSEAALRNRYCLTRKMFKEKLLGKINKKRERGRNLKFSVYNTIRKVSLNYFLLRSFLKICPKLKNVSLLCCITFLNARCVI